MVGKVPVGGDAQISVQSMTNTLTSDAAATIRQILDMEAVGVDIARVSCPDKESTLALPEIIRHINVPLVADIHFDYHRGIEAADAGVACLRINPGNIGGKDKVSEVLRAAKANGCVIRIGINGGSLEKGLLEKYGEPCADAMVESAMNQAKMLEDGDFTNFKISVKSSSVLTTVEAYRKLAAVCDYPLHLGLTEAGGLRSGLIKSGIGMGALLMEGIGDTIRVSLTADVKEEVKAGFELLKALDLRYRGVRIVACPTCARKGYDVEKVVTALEDRLSGIIEPINVSVLGCVVNGIGEAAHSDIGVAGGGAGVAVVFIGGKQMFKVTADEAVDKVVDLVTEAVEFKQNYSDWLSRLQNKYTKV